MDVEGKVVAITGAARGLGREFATSLAAAGARVVIGDLSDCTDTLDLVRQAGPEGIGVTLDVTDIGSAGAMIEAGMRAFGRLDALVNNAALYGALHGGRFDAIDETEWDAAMAVNVKGIWNCCKAAVPAMRRSIADGAGAQGTGGGSIVNIASLAATYGMPYGLHYTTSKAAVIGLTRGLARELGRDRIRVNALAPSAVITEGTREFFGDKLDRALETIKAGQTIQRNLMPQDLVGVVLWLVSDASGFVTGQTIAVDGGTVML
ncbi:MAG: SDR family NAD(P)-dependent oxidoreductase [Alphaproteobacteria bacterium]